MMNPVKPLMTAIEGKGFATLAKRTRTIARRYGLTFAKMGRSLAQLSRILQQFDCQATLPVTAIALARNSAVIQKHQSRGIEFAIHGYRHIDYSQLSLEEQCTHFRKASQVFRDHGVHFDGFRCPYLRWNEHTLAALSQTHFTYDSSPSLVWDVGEEHTTASYTQVLNFYGAQPAADYLALPYLDAARNLVRIPYCLPDDESLVERLRWRSPVEMNQVWPAMFRQIHEQGGLFTLGLHPERIKACSDVLIATLQEARAATPAVWCARLSEIAAWWKARYVATVDVADVQDDVLQLTVNGPEGTTLLLRSLDVQTTAERWCDGYQCASEMPCVVRLNKRPFIGVSPASSPALMSFLKQQGYITEISLNPDLYSFYLDCDSFSREDERPLVVQIEEADSPLARLSRWPNGAQSALAITGDIDALTLWDYGLRFFGK
jgi:peptidoglycan/xylan/chitin deacetylase (PgdA/CDA1 family)